MNPLEISFLDLWRCSDCEELSEEKIDEPIYQCPKCEEKTIEERCECAGRGRKTKKLADERCASCDAGEVDVIDGMRCDRCGDLLDAEDNDKLYDHILECFADEIAEEAGKQARQEGEKVAAVLCPYCGALVVDGDEEMAAHLSGSDSGAQCDDWSDLKQSIVDAGIEAAQKAEAHGAAQVAAPIPEVVTIKPYEGPITLVEKETKS